MFTQSEKTEPYERERPVARLYNTMNANYQKIIKQLAIWFRKRLRWWRTMALKTSLPKETNLILEPTKYPRTDPDIIFGKTKPTISKKGFRNTLMITTLY